MVAGPLSAEDRSAPSHGALSDAHATLTSRPGLATPVETGASSCPGPERKEAAPDP